MDIATIRCELERLDRVKRSAYKLTQSITEEYIRKLDGKRGIFISDHAMVRYMERVKNYTFDSSMTDTEKLSTLRIPPQRIRKEMLSLEEDRTILRGQKTLYNKGKYSYLIKELTIVTVLLN